VPKRAELAQGLGAPGGSASRQNARTVALARRISVVRHHMWRDGTDFRFTRDEAMAAMTLRTS